MTAPILLSTRIPFSGFYESIWSSEIDRAELDILGGEDTDFEYLFRQYPALAIIPEREIDMQRLYDALWYKAMDYGKAHDLVARDYAGAFVDWLAESLDLKAVPHQYEEMTSPREYNFETDRVFVKLPRRVFTEICKRIPDKVEAQFRDMFTSRSGFHSYYPATVPDKPLAEWDHNELYALLYAWVEHEHGERGDLGYTMYERMADGLYHQVDAAVDFDVLEREVAELVADWEADKRAVDPDFTPPTTPCPYTLDLFPRAGA